MRSWILVVVLMVAGNIFASEPTIVGTWHLDKWYVTTPDGNKAEFCKGANGLLIYEASGYVSTAINCPKQKEVSAEYADQYQRQFFYAGTYTVEDDMIYKVVSNSTVNALIGKTVPRHIEKLTAHELILTGPLGPKGDVLHIRWTR